MNSQAIPAVSTSTSLKAKQVYSLAALCLVAGLAIGYFSRKAQNATPVSQAAVSVMQHPGHAGAMSAGHMPSLAEMHQMADTQAAPLLAKLKSDPNNSALLAQVGAIYHSTHQFKEAVSYYSKAVQIDPKNASLHSKLASSLYRSGDIDSAIAQLDAALRLDPKDANSLFNLGMIRLQGKRDPKGAIAAWQKLLKTNPDLSPDRKAEVQKLMSQVVTMIGDQNSTSEASAHGQR